MSDEEKSDKSFVIKDRRRFDSDGNERSDEPSKKTAAAAKPSSEKTEDRKVVESSQSNAAQTADFSHSSPEMNGDSSPAQMNFASFVMSLATQALIQLGEIKPPPGMHIEPDRAAAQQSIEILAMLQNKTKGNLDAEESHLLEQILHNLRMSYVKAVSTK